MDVEVIIETPQGSRNKYKRDQKSGRIRLDRMLFTSTVYPLDYGEIPNTLAEDGDPLDVLVWLDEPTFPGCLVTVRPVAVFWMADERGPDAKLLGVAAHDVRKSKVTDLPDVPRHLLNEIGHFFDIYKALEPGKSTDVRGWMGRTEAERVIRDAEARAGLPASGSVPGQRADVPGGSSHARVLPGMKPDQTLAWMHDGTGKLLAHVAALSDAELTAPTELPGWNRRYLLSHIAANADALRNLAHWARTGEERRMYVSVEQRNADIAKGAQLPAGELRTWLESSAQALAADLDALPVQAWDAEVITAQGLTRKAEEIPWMRGREVYIHAVDLRAGTAWTDLPAEFLTALLDDVTAGRSARGGGPALALAATDTGHTWEVAGTGAPLPVSAPLADLAAYLTGRPAPALKAAPALPAWL